MKLLVSRNTQAVIGDVRLRRLLALEAGGRQEVGVLPMARIGGADHSAEF
jgi:hypothetical protein